MAKNKKPPDTGRVLLENFNYLCNTYGVGVQEQRILLRMCPATLCKRKKSPETFTLDEIIAIANRFNITVAKLLTKRQWM